MSFPWKKYGWATTVLACFVAGMHVYFFFSALVHKSYLTDDSIQYLTLAENMAESGVFSQSFTAPIVPDLQRTPGYPLFLLLLGRSPVLILLLQHLMVLGAAWFVYKIGLDLYGHRIALSGAKLYLLQPYPVIFASYILSEVPFIFCLVVAVWAYLRFWRGGGLPRLILAMVMLVVGAYLRPVALPLLFLASLLAVIHSLRLPRQRLIYVLPALLLPAMLIGPWWMRNHQVSGKFTFSTMGDMGMIHGRLGGLETWRNDGEMHEHQFYMAGDSIASATIPLGQMRTYPIGKQTHETEILAPGMTGMTLKFFLNHPWDAFRFECWTIWQMLKGVGYGWAKDLTHSKVAAAVSAGVQLLCNALIFTGMLLAWIRRKEWSGAERIVFWTIVTILMISSAVWADGRYRMVADPLLLILAMFTLRRQERISQTATVELTSFSN